MNSIRKSDIALAFFVLAMMGMFLIPLPTIVLDLLLVANLSFAFLLLITSLYIPNALSLLAFPSLLLLTTLFRLSLNVASTRLILSNGEAGEVIATFGSLLIGGEIVVGMILFTIITVVNFVVIAKGSSRVSEVAARFALDALPGKQMAIDADLRAGLISPEQAQNRRDELRKESQLYGAMDGAMKFVQGDAIAGILIIFTNILGGLYVGIINQGLGFQEAIATYTVLTVGDSLVHQIPALLISICAGIVVTRVSSGENTTLGSELGVQLFARPGTLLFSGAFLIVIAPLSGLPIIPFALIGASLIAGGFFVKRHDNIIREGGGRRELGSSRTMMLPGKSPDEERDEELTIVLGLDSAVLHRLYKMNSTRYHSWWQELRSDFFNTYGLSLPLIDVAPLDGVRAASYEVRAGGGVIVQGTMHLDAVLVEVHPDSAAAYGIEMLEATLHPTDGTRVLWANLSPSLRRVTEAGGIRTFDFFEYVGLHIARFYAEHPEELLGVSEVHGLLKKLEKRHTGLLSDAFGKGGVNVALLTELLQRCVKSGLNLRDFKGIVEQIATYCSAHRISLDAQEAIDFDDIIGFIRKAKKRHLIEPFLTLRHSLKIITVHPTVEQQLDEAPSFDDGGVHALLPAVTKELRAGIDTYVQPLLQRGVPACVVVCSRAVLGKCSQFLEEYRGAVGVIAREELTPQIPLERVGEWSI
jgi:type III secretion protein V